MLYYITDRTAFPGDEPARRRLLLDKISEAARCAVEYIQLREKDLSLRELEGLAREAVKVISEAKMSATGNGQHGTALLINSRTDVALAVGAEGVHLRSDDVSPSEVRAIWQCGASTHSASSGQALAREHSPRKPIVAVSCHSPQEVNEAAAQGATLAVFAPVFEKKDASGTRSAGLDALKEVCRAGIPVLALGGVTLENAQSCLGAGAAGLAGIRLFQENDIATVVQKLRGLTITPAHETSASVAAEPTMVRVREGWFLMGSNSGQDCERPVHRIWVEGFSLAATQVTNAEYAFFQRATSAQPPPFWSDPKFSHPQQPVAGVSWFEATRYCEWLSSQTGRNYRLPTEAEWERAARGGFEQKNFPWGDQPPQSLPDYATRWQTGPEPVARYAANAFGLYDICDNVHEWCSDWYDPNYYASSPERNPQGPASGQRKASRGGSWRHQVKVARCSARSSIPPEFQYADYGFRVACDP